jgi:PIN domain nuclease of toxin-antitoxin system
VNDGNLVADSSALLAALKNEPFSNIDPRELVGATISAVNLCEVLAKAIIPYLTGRS